MTRSPELDAETKARIEAEEKYRAQVRAQSQQTSTNSVGMAAGLLGSALLAFGTFAPAINAPIVGGINLIGAGNRDGILLIILAGLSVLFALTARNWLIFTAILAALFIGFKIVGLAGIVSDGDSQFIELGWGWIPMILGTLLLFWAGTTMPKAPQGSEVEKADSKLDGSTKLLAVIVLFLAVCFVIISF